LHAVLLKPAVLFEGYRSALNQVLVALLQLVASGRAAW